VDRKSDIDPLERARREAGGGFTQRARPERAAIVFVLGAAVALALGAFGWRYYARRNALTRMQVAGAELSMGGVPLTFAATREAGDELLFEVVLLEPPRGSSLELGCEWLSPGGEIRYRNHWQTKEVDKNRWPTHCRHHFSPTDVAGNWSVRMLSGERVLGQRQFQLR